MAAKKSTFEKAQAAVLKALRGFEETVTGMVSPEPKSEPKAKKTKASTRKSAKRKRKSEN